MAKAAGQEAKPKNTILIEIPVGDFLETDYATKHANVQFRSREQSSMMKRIVKGLDTAGARTANGRRVFSVADAVRWLMEEAAKSGQ